MKYNIKQIDRNGSLSETGKLWSWDQTCDKCGKDCQHAGIMTTLKPNVDEVDFCIQCYRELIDKKIPYEEAYRKYKKN